MAEPFGGSSFLKAYLDSCKRLIKTIVIKSTSSVELINNQLRETYGIGAVNDSDESTWKYYQNISGIYHSTDVSMQVTSLDTLEEITFSKENLLQHTATAQAYSYGTRYYYSLLFRYPDQEQLILGIVNPVDMTLAIDAADGSILGYPPGLIEEQEQTLIPELEGYIKKQLLRWDVKSFATTDSLYAASQHALLYLSLLPKLLNLRLKRCKTNEVHSFHIREYLASNHRLDRYLPYMSLKQALYFYRNINYIERNAGTVEQFKELIQKILTDRRIPLSEYSIRHLNTLDSEMHPLITARRKPINTEYNSAEKDYVSLDSLFNKEKALAYYNTRYYEASADKDSLAIKTARSSVTQSKDLESNMVDYSDSVPDTMVDILLRQLAYMVGNNLYDVIINFRDPKSNEVKSLYAKDAFIYMLYVAYTAQGIDVQTVPKYLNVKYKSTRKVTVSDLLSVVDYVNYPELKVIAQNLVDKQVDIVPCFSVSMFYELNKKVYEESLRHWYVASGSSDFWIHSQIKAMVLKFYKLTELELTTRDMSMSTWLSVNNLHVYDYTYEQGQELALEIFKKSTGLVYQSDKNPANIQKALVNLLMELSSYSVQIIREVNTSQIIPLNWSAVRLGEPVYFAEGETYAENTVGAMSQDMFGSHLDEIDLNTGKFNTIQLQEQSSEQDVLIVFSASIAAMEENVTELLLFSNTLTSSIVNYDINDVPLDLMTGLEEYDRLTNEQKLSIKYL